MTLVTREWTFESGIVERVVTPTNLADILERCLGHGPDLPERIVFTGTDSDGREHAVSFSFASATRSS